ncbi:hypothetical protein HELRODRAFT_169327 [Helobdella robusta]|uniref:Secreted protein n=1 Tax=Helobdella robusta TaxID=6412 RepID=T1F1S4_HELRO|nr:hypothetical protein HELRODRAFT_169327 [Helobdella robusta]ESO08475.1 hypothetical protein HELRODRAFT_169327 [Helobdella robusta]
MRVVVWLACFVASSLLARANEWLVSHPHLKVKTCESIEVKGRYDGVVDTCKSCYFEADHSKRRMRNLYIRALRLWIVPKTSGDPTRPQQIGYVNVVPARNDIGNFDTFGEAIQKFNKHLKTHALPGSFTFFNYIDCG